jgi:hypothetical protein
MIKEELRQQGDVLLFTAAKLPAGATEVKPVNGRLILAEGETTGHAHALDLRSYPNSKLFKLETGELYLSVVDPVIIYHEEHKPVSLPSGTHRVGIVREVDPFSDEIRSVQD